MKQARGAVACGHEQTAEAALEVLRSGGNAVDALIAAFFAACIVEPVLASLGGGGFAMLKLSGQRPAVLDFFTQTPGQKRSVEQLDFENVVVDFGSTTQEFHIGLGAVAVPGAVKGVFELHRRHGSMPMLELVQPARDLAMAGATISELQGFILDVVEPIYIGRESSRSIFESFSQPGHALRPGDAVRLGELSDFMEVLAREGEALFYRGEVATLIEDQSRRLGGLIMRSDMESYEAYWRQPLRMSYRGNRVWLNPPPSAGGALILFSLKLLGRRPPATSAIEHYAMLAEVMDLTNEARLKSTSTEQPWPDLDLLLGQEIVQPMVDLLNNRARAWRGTTHISVVDAAGDVVGMTVSNGEGCGEITPGTGIMFNNMLGEEDVNPAGFHNWIPNQRMSSMMAPTLIECDRGRSAMIGSGGSNRIRTAILQTIVQLVDFDKSPEQATLFPRIHYEDEMLNLEGCVEETVARALETRFPRQTRFKDRNFFFGGVHSVINCDGVFQGAGDPRRAGVFRIC